MPCFAWFIPAGVMTGCVFICEDEGDGAVGAASHTWISPLCLSLLWFGVRLQALQQCTFCPVAGLLVLGFYFLYHQERLKKKVSV